ncbi:F-box/kelch-repeat protein At3g06240-like [Papaver somniferum]|uniref:F-box/kelch-repeat protein At3g06240-like n=1 Tax=Papaver somniferum TaxID=3469 RepID=UPI000E6FA53B|nr:F-box/kelch-repeat protein At3g06240-like [Papaver somniferum]
MDADSASSSQQIEMIQVDSAIKRTRCLQVLGSCNGLVCLKSRDENLIYVWNPSTKEFKEIAKHPYQDGLHPARCRFGYGYDSKTGEYMLGRIYACPEIYNELSIYSLASNFLNIPYLLPTSIQQPVFIDGTLYWIVHRDTESMCSFNIANESFHEFPHLANLELCVIRGCFYLSGVVWKSYSRGIWIMSECGAREPWTKVFDVNTTFDWQENLIHVFKNGEILLQRWWECRDFYLYDPSRGKDSHRKVKLNGIVEMGELFQYVESLDLVTAFIFELATWQPLQFQFDFSTFVFAVSPPSILL